MKKSRADRNGDAELSAYAKALGHPARCQIVRILAELDGCYVGRLADEVPGAPSTLSQHLKVLRQSGLIKTCSMDPPRIKYCIDRPNWEAAQRLFQGLYGIQKNKARKEGAKKPKR